MGTLTPIGERPGRGAPDIPSPTRRRYNRVVAFGLSGEEWDTLTEMAGAEARDPFQQARWLVLQAIRSYEAEAAS